MVLDLMTVLAFFILVLYKIASKVISMSGGAIILISPSGSNPGSLLNQFE